jgi:hypothetical protein
MKRWLAIGLAVAATLGCGNKLRPSVYGEIESERRDHERSEKKNKPSEEEEAEAKEIRRELPKLALDELAPSPGDAEKRAAREASPRPTPVVTRPMPVASPPQALPKDDDPATARHRRACEQGNAAGCYDLGVSYEHGRGGLAKSDAQAAAFYRKACDGDHAAGCNNLGVFYVNGQGGLPKDDAQAAPLYRKACDGGNAWGCNNLGVFYVNGQGGLAKSDAQAAAFYRKACDGGVAAGCYNLGFFHEYGQGGLPKDDAQARSLYRKACDGGFKDACNRATAAAAAPPPPSPPPAPTAAGASCLDIRKSNPSAADGAYRVRLDQGWPTDVLCLMSEDGGGWTLVANYPEGTTPQSVPTWNSGRSLGASFTDPSKPFKMADDTINRLVTSAFRARGKASMCQSGPCALEVKLFWPGSCKYSSTRTSCATAYFDPELKRPTPSNGKAPCPQHWGLVDAHCGVVGSFVTNHDFNHGVVVAVGDPRSLVHSAPGRGQERASLQIWVR